MPPAWVLLDRNVDFSFDAEDDGSAAVALAMENAKAAAKGSYLPALMEFTIALLGTMKAVPFAPQPPSRATFRLLGSEPHRKVPFRSDVACADKGLLVLYAGKYRGPGSSTHGCYLVHDAAAAGSTSLSTVRPPPLVRYFCSIGNGAVVLRRHPLSSAYLLAELATTPEHDLPDAVLHLWRSDSPAPQWVKKEIRLPSEVSLAPGKHDFQLDASFSGPDDSLCWVDLLHGIVICHHPWGPQDPVFHFIPFPEGCPSVGTSERPNRPRMPEIRSAACVGGAIKLVSMVGYLEGWHFHRYRLTTWTLSPDLREWRQDGVFPLEDLWMTDEYRALDLPQRMPICPVLSPREDAVVYVVVNDVVHDQLRSGEGYSKVRLTEVDFRGQYVFGLDMHHNKIISTSCHRPDRMMEIMPRLIAADFCASLLGATDHKREVEASKVGESGKRPRMD